MVLDKAAICWTFRCDMMRSDAPFILFSGYMMLERALMSALLARHRKLLVKATIVPFRNLCFRMMLVAAIAMAVPTGAGAQTTGAVIEGTAAQADASSAPQLSTAAAKPRSSGFSNLNELYFRAGFELGWPEETRFTDQECDSTDPAALYGCGGGNDKLPRGSKGDFGRTSGFELGIGHFAATSLRLEAFVSYRPNVSFAGRANFLQISTSDRQDVSADLSALSGMLVGYVDLPGLGLPRLGSLRPFVGAGGGLSRLEIDETRMEFPRTMTIVPGGRRVNLAWMLAAGIAVPLGERAMVEVAWRYTDHGVIETGRGKGRIVWRDGSRAPLELDLAETRARLEGHGLVISLRYPF